MTGLLAGIVALGGAVALDVTNAAAQDRVTVFAAASLKNALDDVNAAWKAETGREAIISYAASSALAKQIEQGAPADIFISADLDWMVYLSDKTLTKKETETRLLGNRIVLVAPADSSATAEIAPNFDLAALLGDDGHLAMANTDAVPAGKYGKEALQTLGVWSSVETRIAQAENVRAALALVSTGEAPLGIVYQTDAAADPRVKIIAAFPEGTHTPIIYPAAELKDAKAADTAGFFKFIQTATARALFEKQGFTVLIPQASN